jgi:hypothetical protein
LFTLDANVEAKLFNEYINKGVEAQITSQSKIWAQIKKSDKIELGGKYAKQKVRIANSQSARASNSSTYPTAAETTPEETILYLKRAMMLTMLFDGFTLESAMNGGTPVDPLVFEKEGLLETVVDDLSRQTIMDGSGRLCQASTGATSATLLVDSPYFANATKFLKKGRYIDSYLSTVNQIDNNLIVTRDSTTQVTLTGTPTWSDDSWIMNADTYGGATETYGKGEMMGLMGIISAADPPTPNATAGLQGLLVGNYPDWAAVSSSNGGTKRALTEDLIISVLDLIELGTIDVMLITQKLRRVWATIVKDYRLNTSDIMWGGFKGMPFYYDGRQIPMVVDKFVPDGTILGLDSSKLTLYTTKGAEITWEQGRDKSILQKVANKNEFTAEGHIFSNLGVSVRKAFFKICDLTEPA